MCVGVALARLKFSTVCVTLLAEHLVAGVAQVAEIAVVTVFADVAEGAGVAVVAEVAAAATSGDGGPTSRLVGVYAVLEEQLEDFH